MSQKTNFYQLKKLTLVVIPTMENAYHHLQDFVAIMPPIGIASIAATAEKAGYEVSIIDGDAEQITLEQTIERVVGKNPDYVGSTIMTATMDISKRFYEGLKDKMPQVTVIVGGPHVSAIPERTLEEVEAIDICVIGEGDQTVPEILNAIGNGNDLEDIPGIAYRKNNKIIITKKRPALKDLSTLPLPAFHLFNPELYRSYGWNKWVGGYRKPIGVIFTGRGCLGKCNFCATHTIFGQGIRYFTFQQIKDQIDYLIDKWKIRVLYFRTTPLRQIAIWYIRYVTIL